MRHVIAILIFSLLLCGGAQACSNDGGSTLTIYSGRTEELVGPLLEQFSDETGIKVRVRYGDTGELAATILEEGNNSPADVFFAQDAGALGVLDFEGRLATLEQAVLDLVPPGFRADDGVWIGISGRARVVAYNVEAVSEADLPDTIDGFTAEEWDGRIGWVPTNASFQSFVTAFRLQHGDAAAGQWLEGIKANDPTEFPNNAAAVEAVARGEVDVAFVNHYYLFRFLAEEGDDFGARNHFMRGGDAGGLVNVAGAGIIEGTGHSQEAVRFLEFMLSAEAQRYFAEETYEYPLAAGVPANAQLPALSDLHPPDIDLSDLRDLQGTQELLRGTGVIP